MAAEPDATADAAIAAEPSRNLFSSWFGGRAPDADASFASNVAQTVMPLSPATRTGELVDGALSLLGIGYRFGGTSPASGFDCSGMVGYVFRNTLGLSLPRRAEEISRVGTKVRIDELRPGDLVFYKTLRKAFSHVGIYLGNNRFIHAPSAGGAVRVDSMTEGYWSTRFNGARRME